MRWETAHIRQRAALARPLTIRADAYAVPGMGSGWKIKLRLRSVKGLGPPAAAASRRQGKKPMLKRRTVAEAGAGFHVAMRRRHIAGLRSRDGRRGRRKKAGKGSARVAHRGRGRFTHWRTLGVHVGGRSGNSSHRLLPGQPACDPPKPPPWRRFVKVLDTLPVKPRCRAGVGAPLARMRNPESPRPSTSRPSCTRAIAIRAPLVLSAQRLIRFAAAAFPRPAWGKARQTLGGRTGMKRGEGRWQKLWPKGGARARVARTQGGKALPSGAGCRWSSEWNAAMVREFQARFPAMSAWHQAPKPKRKPTYETPFQLAPTLGFVDGRLGKGVWSRPRHLRAFVAGLVGGERSPRHPWKLQGPTASGAWRLSRGGPLMCCVSPLCGCGLGDTRSECVSLTRRPTMAELCWWFGRNVSRRLSRARRTRAIGAQPVSLAQRASLATDCAWPGSRVGSCQHERDSLTVSCS